MEAENLMRMLPEHLERVLLMRVLPEASGAASQERAAPVPRASQHQHLQTKALSCALPSSKENFKYRQQTSNRSAVIPT